jgi:hypothetical protein
MSKEGKEIFITDTGRLRWKEVGSNGKEYWRYSNPSKGNKVNSKENFLIADDKRPYQYSKTDKNYLAYHSRKMKLRSEYPNWMKMTREQWLEYYTKVIELTQTDKDYKYFWEVTMEGIVEKERRDTLERRIRRNLDNPNGFQSDDY